MRQAPFTPPYPKGDLASSLFFCCKTILKMWVNSILLETSVPDKIKDLGRNLLVDKAVDARSTSSTWWQTAQHISKRIIRSDRS